MPRRAAGPGPRPSGRLAADKHQLPTPLVRSARPSRHRRSLEKARRRNDAMNTLAKARWLVPAGRNGSESGRVASTEAPRVEDRRGDHVGPLGRAPAGRDGNESSRAAGTETPQWESRVGNRRMRRKRRFLQARPVRGLQTPRPGPARRKRSANSMLQAPRSRASPSARLLDLRALATRSSPRARRERSANLGR